MIQKIFALYQRIHHFLYSETSCKILVNKSHIYYDQIQMQLALTKQSWCDLIFYTSRGLIIHRLQFEETHWHRLQTNFYFQYMLDKVVNFQSLWKVLKYWKIFSNNPFYVTDLSQKIKNQKFSCVFSGYNRRPVGSNR